MTVNFSSYSNENHLFSFFSKDNEMTEEPAKKRQKSDDSKVTNLIRLSTSDHEEEDNQLDKQIEQEEKKADNLVIKDLMGSVKPEPNKVIKQKIYLKKNHFFI
jgi:hypothetical protein